MNTTTCDQCKQPMTTVTAGFRVSNMARLSAASSATNEPNTLDLCSWRCMEDYARDRAT